MHIFTVVSYVYRTHEIGKCPIIRSNKTKNTLHINITVKCSIVKYQKLRTVRKKTRPLKI